MRQALVGGTAKLQYLSDRVNAGWAYAVIG